MAALAALLALALAGAHPAYAQGEPTSEDYPTRETLPEGVVLVVKLVSADEIIPTTGVVVAYGRVILPAAFVTDTLDGGPALAVMDGGGSISLNGRPATVREIAQDGGLAILDVPGLVVPPVTLAERPGADGDELRFGAFPPARLMATGHGPMWLPAHLNANVTAGVYGLAETPKLPNLTGPLFNHCDQWVGYALAMGEPDMASPLPPIVMFDAELRRVLTRLGAPALSTAPCARPVAAPPTTEPAAADEPTGTTESIEDDNRQDLAEDETEAGEVAERPAEIPAQVSEPETEPAPPAGQTTPPSAAPRATSAPPEATWLAWVQDNRRVVGGVLLVVVILLAIALQRRRRPSPPGAEDPDTVELVEPVLPRGLDKLDETPANSDRWPPGADAWLRATAVLPDGNEVRSRCGVAREAFACVLGRADADLVLDHPSVSRAHLRVEARDGQLSIGDLGSTNGTAINAARCQPGEIVYIEPGMTVGVGELSVRFTLDTDEDSPK